MLELIFLEGDRRGESIRLTFDKAWFGRQPTCDFVLPGETVSLTHFEILRRGADYVLSDNKSRNGTFVNGVRTIAVTLHAGYQIVAGPHVIEVREVAEDASLGFRFVAEHKGGEGGAQVIERTAILLGRKSTCHVQLNDPAISPVHAEIERRPEGVWITDRSSDAGVHVNGQRIVSQQLRHADVVSMRPFEITIGLTDEICILGISELVEESQATENLPSHYRDVVTPQHGGAGEAKPSSAIAALPVWMQAKAPIWVPTSDILPNRFRSRLIVIALLAVLASAAYVWIARRHSFYSPGPTAKFHSVTDAAFRERLQGNHASTECATCHSGFRRVRSSDCQSCHAGVHAGAVHDKLGIACAGCHSEHRGSQFDVARDVGGGCQASGCHSNVHEKQRLLLAKQSPPDTGVKIPLAVALEAPFTGPDDPMHAKHVNLKGECGNCHTSGDPTTAVPRQAMRMRCLGCHGFGPEATLRLRCYSCHFEHPTKTPEKVLATLRFPDSPAPTANLAESNRSGGLMFLAALAGVPLLYFAVVAGRFRLEHGSFRTRIAASLSGPRPAAPARRNIASAPAPPPVAAPKPTDNQTPGGNLRPRIDLDLCVGCGTCVHVCPFNVLEIVNEKAIAARLDDCTGYAACVAECPTEAIQLVAGGAMQTVELPVYDATLQTNVPALYLAGEVTGKALIKVAINQGKKVVESILSQRPQPGEHFDVIVVGAGPAGTSAALAALHEGLKVLVLEQGTTANTIRNYPRQKFVMAEPVMIPVYGPLWMEDSSKESLLERWEQIIASTGLTINEEEKVLRVVQHPGHFLVESAKGEYRGARVVLAIGRRGSPRKLGVPGEDSAKVAYNLLDAEAYRGQAICVVGGGDSGIEAANGLARAELENRVWLIHRGEDFVRAKPRNQTRVQKSIDQGRLKVFFNARVQEIRERSLLVKTAAATEEIDNDFVFVMVGGESPKKFLTECGIEFSQRPLG